MKIDISFRMIFKKLIIISLLLLQTLYAGTITIAVALNVSYAIPTIKKEFQKLYPDINVIVILGSSGKLTAQIKNGAPYELFMSANMYYPNSLYKDKIATTKPTIYAQGTLAILSIKKLTTLEGIEVLKDKNIKKIAIANPKTAPYGKATLEVLKRTNIYKSIKKKLVYGESISQTISYTLNAADIGVVAKSSLYSPKMSMFKKDINWMDVDIKLYTPIEQGIVILKNAKTNTEVLNFYNFILSQKAKQIFRNFGYLVS